VIGSIFLALGILIKPTAGVFFAPFLVMWSGASSWHEIFTLHVLHARAMKYMMIIILICLPSILYYAYINVAGDSSLLNHSSWWISITSLSGYITNPLYQLYLGTAFLVFNPIGWILLASGLFLSFSQRDFFVQATCLVMIIFGIAMSPQWLQFFHEWHYIPGVLGMALVGAKLINDWPGKFRWGLSSPWVWGLLYGLFIIPALYVLFFISNTNPAVIFHNVKVIKEHTPPDAVVAVSDPGSTITNFYLGRIGVYAGGELTEEYIRSLKDREATYLGITRRNLSVIEKKVVRDLPLVYKDELVSLHALHQ
jgi:hypothetical protein